MTAHTFGPEHIADIDQYLASLDDMIVRPLQTVREAIAEAGGDRTIAYLTMAQDVVDTLEYGGPNARVDIGMSFVGLLMLLHRKANQ